MRDFHYQHPAVAQTTSRHAEPAAPAFEEGRRESSSGQATTSRRSLPTSQPSQASESRGPDLDAHNPWQSMTRSPTQARSAIRSSPKQPRTKKPAPVSQSYDDSRPQQASSWVGANQSVPVTTQPARNSPSQTAAQPARGKSRQSNRAQNPAQVNSMSTPQQAHPQGSQSLAGNSGYATAATTQKPSSIPERQHPGRLIR